MNFILRRDYRGAEVGGQVGVPQHPGGDQYQATATAGFGDLAADRYNVFVNVDWQQQRAIAARQRDFAKTGQRPDEGLEFFSETSYPGGIARWFGNQIAELLYPSAATGCAPPLSFPKPGTVFPCAFDAISLADIVPPSESLTAFARGTLQLAAEHQLFAEYSYARRTLQTRFPPTPVARHNSPELTSIRYPAGGPYYPTEFAAEHDLTGDLEILFRTMELGHRIDEVRTEGQRLLAGAEGRIGAWDYSTAYDHSIDEARDTFAQGYVSTSRMAAAMQTGLINPFGPSGDAGLRVLATAELSPEAHRAKGTLDLVDFRASTQWSSLPGGAIGFAAGAEARRERLDDTPSPAEATGDLMATGSIGSEKHASRRAEALFVEGSLPFLPSLEALVSARYDHYSDFGGTTNAKIALRWQPARELLFRGAWGTGFRAPTLVDLHGPQTATYVGLLIDDPLRCPVTGAPLDCQVLFPALEGGNPDLRPERSTQYTLGAVWEPLPGTSASIQYWHIDVRDAISTLDGDTIFGNIDVFGDSNVVRHPPEDGHPSLPGPVKYVIVYQQNVGRLTTAGVDVGLRTRSPPLTFGRISASLDGTYISKFETHLTGLPPESMLGTIGILGPVPRWRHYAAVSWEQGPWTATLAQTFQNGYADANPLPDDTSRRVGTYSVWDIQASYTGWRNLTPTLGVRNLFDRNPPFSNGTSNGFDPAYADPRGRTYYARLRYAFK